MKQTHSISKLPQFSTLTREQGMSVISPAKTQKVVARAGSGKTKLAMAYTAARPRARGLYLAFGKPTQMEAASRLRALGVNTEARTSHSLAFQSYGSKFKERDKETSSLRVGVTAELLGVNWPIARAVNATITNYVCSANKEIGEQHLPKKEEMPIVGHAAGMVMDSAKKLWARMINLDDTAAKVVPDVYLKLWANTDPKLAYDFIIFDECQDANPLLAHLVNSQEHTTRLYIGDPHQSIFGFRGAVNLMDELVAEETHNLTASFRFGHNIGLLASTFLRHWKNEPLPLRGLGKLGPVTKSDQQAYLSRTVAGLIGKGFELHEKGHKLHWVKGFKDYRASSILDAYKLFKGESTAGCQDPVIKMMRSWSDLKDYVEMSKDSDAGAVYRLIEKHRDDIPNIIATLDREQVHDGHAAPLVLTTAHRSKGLEWPVVRLVNDFFSFKDNGDKWLPPTRVDPQEANLTYVALTRAMKAIAPTPEMVEWFRTQPDTQRLFPEPKAPAPAPEPEPETPAAEPQAEMHQRAA